jgi:RNA polymerase sigma-70 factor (ECF subfamily)
VSSDRVELEARILESLSAGDFHGAATRLLQGYGGELYGFLLARLRDEAAANEAFSRFTEDLWRGLPGYERRSTLRVWAYTLARHAAIREQASPHRKRARNLSLDAMDPTAELDQLEQKVRTETAPFLRTEFKTRVAKLRERLSEEERTLLILRVDRGLDWADVARVFFPEGSTPTDAALKAETSRIRKRFQLIKAKIRKLALDDETVP